MNRIVASCLALVIAAAMPVAAATAQEQPRIGAAPAGDPSRVALRVIHANFGPGVCPRMRQARRLPNGSIHAACVDGETFRVFQIGGRAVAMRCAAAARYGIEGC